jgi:hypothetical protein
MTTEAFAAMARNHWKKWLPKKWAALKESGELEASIRAAAQMATDEKRRLMAAGYQEHEADEVVKAELILLPPERGNDREAEPRVSLAERKAAASVDHPPMSPLPRPSRR